MRTWASWLVAVALATSQGIVATPVAGQELEARALANIPVGTNFLIAGYALSRGNVLLDPVIQVENLNATLHTGIFAYVRALDVSGLAGKVDVIVPIATGRWTGVLDNQDTSRIATGFGDPRLRFSVNFVGTPALTRDEFAAYRPGTVVGASMQVWVPIGQYDPDRLLNLGSHRWTFHPQLGIAHTTGPWTVESYVSIWLYTTNGDFFGGNTLQQHPFLTAKAHLIRLLSRRFWLALDAGLGAGARGVVNGVPGDNYQSAVRVGITGSGRIANGHALRVGFGTTQRIDKGPDFDAFSVAYQFSWGG